MHDVPHETEAYRNFSAPRERAVSIIPPFPNPARSRERPVSNRRYVRYHCPDLGRFQEAAADGAATGTEEVRRGSHPPEGVEPRATRRSRLRVCPHPASPVREHAGRTGALAVVRPAPSGRSHPGLPDTTPEVRTKTARPPVMRRGRRAGPAAGTSPGGWVALRR